MKNKERFMNSTTMTRSNQFFGNNKEKVNNAGILRFDFVCVQFNAHTYIFTEKGLNKDLFSNFGPYKDFCLK